MYVELIILCWNKMKESNNAFFFFFLLGKEQQFVSHLWFQHPCPLCVRHFLSVFSHRRVSIEPGNWYNLRLFMFLVMSDKKNETMSTWMCVNPTIEQEAQASLCHHAITTQLPKSYQMSISSVLRHWGGQGGREGWYHWSEDYSC